MGRRKILKRRLERWLIRVVTGIARLLPRRVGLAVFSRLGLWGGRLFKKDRHRAVENLGIAFPDSPQMVREAMAEAMYRALGRNVYDFLAMRHLTGAGVEEIVTGIDGREHFAEAYGRGRGVLAVTGHIGCWELMPAYFVRVGYKVSVIARRMRDGVLDRELLALRAQHGVTTIDRDASPRQVIDTLRAGEAIGVLIDQHTRVAGAYVPFFGRPAYTPTGVARIALMTGAAIVPLAIFAERDGRHRVRVFPAIEPPVAADRETAILELTAACSRAVEDLIRIDPKQWVWFHDRWRDSVKGEITYAIQG